MPWLIGELIAGELELVEQSSETRVRNTKYLTMPSVIHGNGPSKVGAFKIML